MNTQERSPMSLRARQAAAGGLLAAALLLGACASAPDRPLHTRTLSEAEIAVLEAGGNAAMVLPAELNGYPSPSRVLAWRDELGLTPDQRFELTRLQAVAQGKARAMGERVINAERELDIFMAAAKQPMDRVRARLDKIAALRAALRGILIESHLDTYALLTDAQRERYAELADLPPPPVKVKEEKDVPQTPLY